MKKSQGRRQLHIEALASQEDRGTPSAPNLTTTSDLGHTDSSPALLMPGFASYFALRVTIGGRPDAHHRSRPAPARRIAIAESAKPANHDESTLNKETGNQSFSTSTLDVASLAM